MRKPSGLKPGSKTPNSGQYVQVGPKGGQGKEVTIVINEPMPPTPKPNMTYTLVDPTNNKSGKR